MTLIDRLVKRFVALLPAPSSEIRAAILAVLASGPQPTLRIIDRLHADHRLTVSYARGLAILRALEDDGAITSYDDFTDCDVRGGRPRRVYRLDKSGGVRDDEREDFLSARAVQA